LSLSSLHTQIFENLPDAIILTDAEGFIIAWNPAAERLFGYTSEEAIGKTPLIIMEPATAPQLIGQISLATQRHGQWQGVVCYRRKDGVSGIVQASSIPLYDPQGIFVGRLGIGRIPTAQEQISPDLKATLFRLHTITETVPVGIFMTDPEGNCLYTNPAYQRITGMSFEETLGDGWAMAMHPDDREKVMESWSLAAQCGVLFESEQRFVHKDGRTLHTRMRARQILDGETLLGYVATVEDITERKTAESLLREQTEQIRNFALRMAMQNEQLEASTRKLEDLAATDGLTELKNHRAFQERLEMEALRTERYGAPLSLLLLDIDRFKEYNDTFGHPAGDQALKEVAGKLAAFIRDTDFAARYGGEEFAIILPETENIGALALAERVRVAVSEIVNVLRPLTVSIGVATWSANARDRLSLITRADRALYAAKHAGGNCVVCLDREESEAKNGLLSDE
jgi:diguanylate cyclase (GGDEF)-like protein/PAS domain S-box-containing protein